MSPTRSPFNSPSSGGLGGEVVSPPDDTGAGRLAVLRDPLGALFLVVAEAPQAG